MSPKKLHSLFPNTGQIKGLHNKDILVVTGEYYQIWIFYGDIQATWTKTWILWGDLKKYVKIYITADFIKNKTQTPYDTQVHSKMTPFLTF